MTELKMSEEFTYAIGNEIIQQYDKAIMDSLPELYPDEGEKAIVEVLLIPQFREKLNGVFEEFLEEREKGKGTGNKGVDKTAPITGYEIPSLCKAIDEVIEGNRQLLAVDSLLKPVFKQIQINRASVGEELGEESRQHFVDMLSACGIKNKLFLLQKGPIWFQKADFPPYGKGFAFAGQILGKKVGKITLQILEEIANKLEFEEINIDKELYIKILAEQGITNRLGLIEKSSTWFKKASFPPFGKGNVFANRILGEKRAYLTNQVLEEIANGLGFEKINNDIYLQILANYGITDCFSLIRKGVSWFIKTDFPPFGKGAAFAGQILGITVSYITTSVLEEIADKLGFAEINTRDYLRVLSEQGINNRLCLIEKGSTWFIDADFPPFGKGTALCSKILAKTVSKATHSILEEIADKLGFAEINTNDYLRILSKQGITDRLGLIEKGSIWFRDADFPPFGKGLAFASQILGETGFQVTDGILERIADQLGFEKINKTYIQVLALHGITDRSTLLAKGTSYFNKTDFYPFGKGAAFCSKIIGRTVRKATNLIREEVADKLGFTEICNEDYLRILSEQGISDRLGLIEKGSIWFKGTDFSPFGKGKAFAAQILGRTDFQITYNILEEIADKLGFERFDNKTYRNLLLTHGIGNRLELIDKGQKWFRQTDFPPFGKGTAFACKILGKTRVVLNTSILEEIADILFSEDIPKTRRIKQNH